MVNASADGGRRDPRRRISPGRLEHLGDLAATMILVARAMGGLDRRIEQTLRDVREAEPLAGATVLTIGVEAIASDLDLRFDWFRRYVREVLTSALPGGEPEYDPEMLWNHTVDKFALLGARGYLVRARMRTPTRDRIADVLSFAGPVALDDLTRGLGRVTRDVKAIDSAGIFAEEPRSH